MDSFHLDYTNGNSNNRTAVGISHDALLSPPCTELDTESDRIKICCDLLDKIYHGDNLEQIMTLMKYSLGLLSPSVSQYTQKLNQKASSSISDISRLMSQDWLLQNQNILLRIFSNQNRLQLFEDLG